MKFQNLLNKAVKEVVKKDKEVIAVLVFGSFARGESYRDIDICIVLDKKYAKLHMSRKKLKYSSLLPSKYDVSIFQQLPLYIRMRVLKDGKVLLSKNEDLLYNIAFSTIKEFNMYSKIYNTYLEFVENEKRYW